MTPGELTFGFTILVALACTGASLRLLAVHAERRRELAELSTRCAELRRTYHERLQALRARHRTPWANPVEHRVAA